MKEDDIDGACSKYGAEEKCIVGFSGEVWKKEITWKT
jgi:hypothetical protein